MLKDVSVSGEGVFLKYFDRISTGRFQIVHRILWIFCQVMAGVVGVACAWTLYRG